MRALPAPGTGDRVEGSRGRNRREAGGPAVSALWAVRRMLVGRRRQGRTAALRATPLTAALRAFEVPSMLNRPCSATIVP